MNPNTQPNGFSALFAGLKSALQWRPLLWWLLALGLPTLSFSVPLWAGLQGRFGHSVLASDVAGGRNFAMLLEGIGAMRQTHAAAISLGTFAALALTALLSPWLTGMVVATLRAGRPLNLGELAQGGLREYWRMARMLLWSLLPLGAVVVVGAALLAFVGKQAETAVLESDVTHSDRLALGALAVLFTLVHLTIEAGRGWLGAQAQARSVFLAWWRGTLLALRRPLASLIVYVGCGMAGYLLAAAWGYLRLRADGDGFGSFVIGLLLTQLAVAALAWGRIARLHGFAALARGRIAAMAAATTTAATPPVLAQMPAPAEEAAVEVTETAEEPQTPAADSHREQSEPDSVRPQDDDHP